MSLTFENLKIFCDVVRERSFSRGAELNDVTQPSASQTVSQIEKHLGIKLINRSTRPFTMTPDGQHYYEECRDLVDRYLALESRYRRAAPNGGAGRVNVASIYSVVLYDMNHYVERFKERQPHGSVKFKYFHPDEVMESVLEERADMGLMSFPKPHRDIAIIAWREEPMTLVCAPGHPLTTRDNPMLEDLEDESFVAFEESLSIRREIDRFLRKKKVEVDPVIDFDNIEAIKRAIEKGEGISILPAATVRVEVENGSLKTVNLPELDLTRPLCIIHRRGRALTPAMEDFIAVLREDDGATPMPPSLAGATTGAAGPIGETR